MNTFYFNFLRDLKNEIKFEISHQPNYLGRYNPSLNTLKNGFIDWSLNPYDLFNFINAFDDPFIEHQLFLNQNKYGRLFIKKFIFMVVIQATILFKQESFLDMIKNGSQSAQVANI